MDSKKMTINSGTVLCVEAAVDVPIAIMWVTSPTGKEVGFVFAHRNTADCFGKAISFCKEQGVSFFNVGKEQLTEMEKSANFEMLTPKEFLNRFGDYPHTPGLILDSGGSIDDANELLGVESLSSAAMAANVENNRSMLNSAVASAAMMLSIALAFVILGTIVSRVLISATTGENLSIGFTFIMMLSTIAFGVGLFEIGRICLNFTTKI